MTASRRRRRSDDPTAPGRRPTSTTRTTSGTHGRLPRLDLETLLRLAEESGLTGRGGAGFPTGPKCARCRGRGARRRGRQRHGGRAAQPQGRGACSPRNPHLVLDGLDLVGEALGARRRMLRARPGGTSRRADRGGPRGTVGSRSYRFRVGFVAGQESALVNAAARGAPASPATASPRVTEQAASAGGPRWCTTSRRSPTSRWSPGTAPGGSAPSVPPRSRAPSCSRCPAPWPAPACSRPRAAPASATCWPPAHPSTRAAVLVGGYHGAWVPGTDLDVRLSRVRPGGRTAPRSARASCSCWAGTRCRAGATPPSVAGYLAGEAAGQCGPCVNGLPRMADTLQRLAAARARRPAAGRGRAARRRSSTGRGACAHPDGTARFVASTMATFGDHVDLHLAGYCPTERRGGRR